MANKRQRLMTGRSSPIQLDAVPEPAEGLAALGPSGSGTQGKRRIIYRDSSDLPMGKLSGAPLEKFAHGAVLRRQAPESAQAIARGPPAGAKVERPLLRQLCLRGIHPHKVQIPRSARGAERTASPVALPESPHSPLTPRPPSRPVLPHAPTPPQTGPAELIAMPRQCIFGPKPETTGTTGPVLRSGGKRQRTGACFSKELGRRDCSRPSPCAS